MLGRTLFLSLIVASGMAIAQVHLPTAAPPATPATGSESVAPAPLAALPAKTLPAAATPQPVILPYPAPARLPAYGGPLDDTAYTPVVAWARAEALLWWIQGRRLPSLLSQSPTGTPLDQAGVLGTPGTQTIFGGGDGTGGLRLGGRYTLGFWVDDGCKSFGLEGSFFHLPSFTDSGFVGGDGITGRPFVNALTGLPDAELVSFPGVLAGTATADLRSSLMGADALLRCPLCYDPCQTGPRCDLLVGYRWLHYGEDLTVRENLFPQGQEFVPGTNIQVFDSFRVRNQFHGVFLGLAGTWRLERFTLEAMGRVSVGHLHRNVQINGQTTVLIPGEAAVVNKGGLLAQRSNIGNYDRSTWTAIPEADLRLGYDLTDHLRLFAGYSLLVLNDFYRVADVVDTTINPNLIPPGTGNGPLRPAFQPNSGTIWVHGVTLGAELRF